MKNPIDYFDLACGLDRCFPWHIKGVLEAVLARLGHPSTHAEVDGYDVCPQRIALDYLKVFYADELADAEMKENAQG